MNEWSRCGQVDVDVLVVEVLVRDQAVSIRL
jgi:hypothetical protein